MPAPSPDVLKSLLDLGKFVSPGGLPGAMDWVNRQGRRLRKKFLSKARVPICLAITADDIHDGQLIGSIAHNMRQYLEQRHLSSTVQVHVVPDEDLKNVTGLLRISHDYCERQKAHRKMPHLDEMPGDFRRLHEKYRARMYVFGSMVPLTSAAGNLHELHLEGVFENRIVRIPPDRSIMEVLGSRKTRVESVFSDMHVSNVVIPMADEAAGTAFLGFFLVNFLQMLIGLGASIQDDPVSATLLLDQLLNDLSVDKPTADRILNILIARASAAAQEAFVNHAWEELRQVAGIIARRFPDNYGAFVSITYAAYYLNPEHPVEALEYAKKASACTARLSNGHWHYNLAFLLAQNHYFKDSLEQYDDLASKSYDDEEATVTNVLAFFQKELRRRPLAVHMLFIVGFIEWKKLGTNAAYCKHAKKMFVRFVRLADSPDLAPWVKRANVYIQKIDKRLGRG